MQISIEITKDGEKGFKLDKYFTQNEITIGRDNNADLVLDDEKKAISRIHAKIQVIKNKCCIIDNKSRNGTYYGKIKIPTGKPVNIENDSIYHIGNYYLKFTFSLEEDTDTVFLNKCDRLLTVLSELNCKINNIKTDQKHYRELLSRGIKSHDLNDVKEVVNLLYEYAGNVEYEHAKMNLNLQSDSVNQEIIELLMEMFVRIFNVSWKFRTEFIGTTIIVSDDNKSMYSMVKLQKFLFDHTISPSIAEKRSNAFKAQVEEAILHQVAILDGYRSSVKLGIQELLKELSPDGVREEVINKNLNLGLIKIPYKYIPMLTSLYTYRILCRRHKEIAEESHGIIEKKIFRPPFVKSYLESMASGQN